MGIHANSLVRINHGGNIIDELRLCAAELLCTLHDPEKTVVDPERLGGRGGGGAFRWWPIMAAGGGVIFRTPCSPSGFAHGKYKEVGDGFRLKITNHFCETIVVNRVIIAFSRTRISIDGTSIATYRGAPYIVLVH